MTTHTPGPWDWLAVGANASGGHHLYITDANGRKIAALWGKVDEKAANAKLIAALPDMLALLREARDDIANGFESDGELEAEHSISAKKLVAKIDAILEGKPHEQ